MRAITGLCLLAVILAGSSLLPARAATVLTNCTESALRNALAQGGDVLLACESTVLLLTNTITIATNSSIEATSRTFFISGGTGTNGVRLFTVLPGVEFTVRNLSLINGRVNGSVGTLSRGGERAAGAAIFSNGGKVKVSNSTFANHTVVGGEGGPGENALGGGGSGRRGAEGGGGLGAAIFNQGGELVLSNVTFLSNTAISGRGGAGGAGGTGGNGGHGGNGGAGGTAAGAAVFNTAQGLVSIFDCTFASNRVAASPGGLGGAGGGNLGFPGESGASGAALGAGVFNDDSVVESSRSIFLENLAEGGAGNSGGNGLAFERKGLPGTSGGSAQGAGLFNARGTLSVTNCTFARNVARGGAGGDGGSGSGVGFGGDGGDGGAGGSATGSAVHSAQGTTIIVNSTVSENSNTAGTGGKGGAGGTTLARAGSAGAGGFAGGAIFAETGLVTLKNSILSGTRGGVDAAGNLSDGGYNLISDSSLALQTATSRLRTDPLLGVLTNNGGTTVTFALSAQSPALNAIIAPDGNGCPSTDQRGVPRLAPCDIGAFEAGAAATGPKLTAQRLGSVLTLSWPDSAFQYSVETAEALSTNWQSLTNRSTLTGNLNVLSLPATNQQRFFRLRR